jgi:hypothetical protein
MTNTAASETIGEESVLLDVTARQNDLKKRTIRTTPTFYVSPAGNDDWSGRLHEPNAAQTDGPLRTLTAAQAAVRKLKTKLGEPAEIRVELRAGIHELDEPWRFHAEDGGFGRTSNRLAKTWPVTWAAYHGETPASPPPPTTKPSGTQNHDKQTQHPLPLPRSMAA